LNSVPKFTQIARSYLLHIGSLDWTQINPDIFGSMIQAVADDEERGALGMHYTSVPNILKVLNPLFLDDLNAQLMEAGNNLRKLLNLRKRLARIRVFDPACGSGNFLVIAYKQMRAIEAEINSRRGEADRASEIPLTNFRGIEIRHFAAEIARLALIIAEYQCDELYRGKRLALAEFLPLGQDNWITHGNALRLDWLKVCPPTGTNVKLVEDDLFQTPLDQTEIDFENEGGETFICGNPPYLGAAWQSTEQKNELKFVVNGRTKNLASLDYVAAWFIKAADFGCVTRSEAAFVATNSICQGQQAIILWPLIFSSDHRISFAHTSFQWSNLASNRAGVTVVIVGISNIPRSFQLIFQNDDQGNTTSREVSDINGYLIAAKQVTISKSTFPINALPAMDRGNSAIDGGGLLLSNQQKADVLKEIGEENSSIVRPFVGSEELIHGLSRYCLWIDDKKQERISGFQSIQARMASVKHMRSTSRKVQTRQLANTPHRFGEIRHRESLLCIVIPRVSSENRDFLPVAITKGTTIIGDRNFAMYDAPIWVVSLVASRIHWVWIATVCVRMRTDFSYSNTLGWNTFPVPPLTDENKADLTRCAEEILLAREAHWPATIAELYDPDKMPADLRAAHDRNDETLERIYIGRRFKNDTERLETLFRMYSEMTAK
jgi:hypothetical protein